MAYKVGMVSLGCAKNQVDGEVLMASLKNAGFEPVDDAALADIAIVNTCGFIESAKRESIEEILELATLKKEGRIKKLVVTGCLSERYQKEMHKELPEVDDEFAKDVSEFDTLADFKKDLGEKLKERRETQNQRDFEAALMEQVMDNMEVEIPDAMVEYEADNLVNDMAQRIQAQGIPFDQYLAMTGMTMDIMREQAKAAALERVRRELALGAIVAAENITISDEELEEEYKRLAEQYHMDVDKVKAAVDAESIRKEQSYHKAEHVVYDSAKVGKAPAKKKSAKKKAEESAEGEELPKKTARKGTSRKKVEETAEAAVEKTEE